MIPDRTFNIDKYLKSKRFSVERKSDTRNIYVKTYFDGWQQKNRQVIILIHHLYPNFYMGWAGGVMEVWIDNDSLTENNSKGHDVIYRGLQPFCFDDAETIFEFILPEKIEFERIDDFILQQQEEATER